MVRHLKAVALVTALIGVACAALPRAVFVWPEPAPGSVRVIIERGALASLESLATVTRRTRKEQAACVTVYGSIPVQKGGWVVAIFNIGPARVVTSDSVTIYTNRGEQLCDKGEPTVHSHIVQNEMWGRPSDFDTLRHRALIDSGYGAPFNVLVSVGQKAPSKVTVYGIR